MNGRIYDPKLGRMLQADPFIQSPTNSQSLNRYSYVLNNPLSYTDPSGYFFSRLWKKWVRPIASIAITAVGLAFAPGLFPVWGALSGWIATGNLQGALVGAFSAIVFNGIDHAFAGLKAASAGMQALQSGAKVLAHGIAGGVMSMMSGGKLGHGFASAGFTQSLGGRIGTIDAKNAGFSIQRVIAAAVLGGTASELSGGKFANGAITGAFSRAFNGELHAAEQVIGAPITDEQRVLAEDGDYISFWKSRYFDSGDPVARTALIGWGHGDLVGASWWEHAAAKYTWNRLESYISDNGLSVSMEQIGARLAVNHVRFVDRDNINIHHLLSPTDVARYHGQVFRSLGIPNTYFGGSRFGNSANLYSWAWCRGCDTSP